MGTFQQQVRRLSNISSTHVSRFCDFLYRTGRVARHYTIEHWADTVFVAAVISLAHHLEVFKALDSYAFVFIGNISAIAARDIDRQQPETMAVLIDAETFENEYAERSPLDRCVLHEHLKKLYDAGPRLLAIDLDISPMIQLSDESSNSELRSEVMRHTICEKVLYELIKQQANAGNAKTLLLLTFEVQDEHSKRRKEEWVKEMQSKGVYFGQAELPVEYGVALQSYTHRPTLSRVAKQVYCSQVPRESAKDCADTDAVFSNATSNELNLINPRNYLRIEPVSLMSLSEPEPGLSRKLNEFKDKVVFFGAAYGQDDTFLTPLGEFYGVEVHAASYVSLLYPTSKLNGLWEFGIHVYIALIFGVVTEFFWGRYFLYRLSSEATSQQIASIWVWCLIASFVLLLISFSYVYIFLCRS